MARSLSTCGTRITWAKKNGSPATEPSCCSRKGAPLWIPLGGAKEIETALNRYGGLVRGTREDDEMAAILQRLYQEVWEPIAQAFPAKLTGL